MQHEHLNSSPPQAQASPTSNTNLTKDALTDARLLIVDDEERNVRLLTSILQRADYHHIQTTTDARDVMNLFKTFAPDLVLLDLHMPHMDGFEVLKQLGPHIGGESFLPVLVLTADVTTGAKNKALAMGAKDFVTKPLDAVEVLLRIKNLLETRFLNQHLEERVVERTAKLERAQNEVLERLAQAAEFRDDDTGQHTRRVGELAALLARHVGLDANCVELMRRAAPLHDVGKIGIPDMILLKPGKLSPEEFEVMKTHTTIGASLLRDGDSELMQIAETIALTHHERWDGSGYPARLSGENIPIEGRILAVVDVFDALTHERPYKQAWPIEQALEEISNQSGRQFDPQVIAAFARIQAANTP